VAKHKQRGFVMTGGGAKGLYEAGVIHAFHITGMEFDVITGSSIGAMNSVFFAEYQYQKRHLPEQVRQDPLKAVEAMDPLVKAYHHAWLLMPEKNLIDDSPQGPIGRLKDDLLKVKINLSELVSLIWWWTDPERGRIPDKAVLMAVPDILRGLVGRFGGLGGFLRLLKDHRKDLFQGATHDYLDNFGMAHSLIPPAEDHKLKDIFTQPVSPLRLDHLQGEVSRPDEEGVKLYPLLDPGRTLRDYSSEGIAVRLTRANYRTGRLEVSAYISLEDFARFMQKQAWRLQKYDPDKIPLGSFRLQVPGNPNAINAALCSGRFPGVFNPFPIKNIYLSGDAENAFLYRLLAGWFEDPQVKESMTQAFLSSGNMSQAAKEDWEKLLASWSKGQDMRDFFPKESDRYVDGGAIDNTPSNSAVDFAREWAEENGLSKRDVTLELFIIFLGVEPKVSPDEVKDPNLFQVVKRTLEIQGVAKESSDANTVNTINTFGKRGEDLGRALQLVLDSYQASLDTLSPEQRQSVEADLRLKALQNGQIGFLGKESDGILERMERWANGIIANGLPMQVDEVKIYPETMPLDTLQFTERFGYNKENTIKMLTMGCYNTLWTLHEHLKDQTEDELDDLDRKVSAMLRHWIDDSQAQPTSQQAKDKSSNNPYWRCLRTQCVFHARHCLHGANQQLIQ
jgi:hypothetical protein